LRVQYTVKVIIAQSECERTTDNVCQHVAGTEKEIDASVWWRPWMEPPAVVTFPEGGACHGHGSLDGIFLPRLFAISHARPRDLPHAVVPTAATADQ
jgi:hypothetical protein